MARHLWRGLCHICNLRACKYWWGAIDCMLGVRTLFSRWSSLRALNISSGLRESLSLITLAAIVSALENAYRGLWASLPVYIFHLEMHVITDFCGLTSDSSRTMSPVKKVVSSVPLSILCLLLLQFILHVGRICSSVQSTSLHLLSLYSWIVTLSFWLYYSSQRLRLFFQEHNIRSCFV